MVVSESLHGMATTFTLDVSSDVSVSIVRADIVTGQALTWYLCRLKRATGCSVKVEGKTVVRLQLGRQQLEHHVFVADLIDEATIMLLQWIHFTAVGS